MPCVPVCAPLAEPRNAGYPGRPLGSQIAAQSLSAHSHEKAPPERGLSDVPASSDLAHVATTVLVHAVLAGGAGVGDGKSTTLNLSYNYTQRMSPCPFKEKNLRSWKNEKNTSEHIKHYDN